MCFYQIYVVKVIVDCINQNCGNGYIWYIIGLGKMFIFFKVLMFFKMNESIYKCFFVVDCKDLDCQM